MVGTSMRSSSQREQVLELVQQLRPLMERVVVFINGKGGAGKTTLTANLGATLANSYAARSSQKRVLVIQLDKQGDLGLDLGFRGTPGDDDGNSIVHAVMGTGKLEVMREVRPGLDVVPGGSATKKAASVILTSGEREKRAARLRFVQAISELAHDYEWILVDAPPGDEELQNLGLAAARWAIIPAQFDRASRYGLEGVSIGFEETDEINPDLDVLGVLMFAFERKDVRKIKDAEGNVVGEREIGQRKRVRDLLEAELRGQGSDAPVFRSVIAYNRAVAEACRERGILVHEMADRASDADWRKASRSIGMSFSSESVEGLAVDYEDVAVEVFKLALDRLDTKAVSYD